MLNYTQAKLVTLRQVNLDEKWLHDRIADDPTILGLGDVTLFQRERRQSAGGRLDLLMYENESNLMYEVEIMLGPLDESHIIRAIEYWDIESRRWPNREHRVVIVAEDLTGRFFNVIALLSRSIPLVAIKLSAMQVEDKIILAFTKVLDIYESPEDEVAASEPTDRSWFERNSSIESLSIVDECEKLLSEEGTPPRTTYRKGTIVFGGVRQNFAWFHPRKREKHCRILVRLESQSQVHELSRVLEDAGISVNTSRDQYLKFNLTPRELKEHMNEIRRALLISAERVGGGLSV